MRKLDCDSVAYICQFLKGDEIAQLSSTCKLLDKACSSPTIWETVCLQDYSFWSQKPSRSEYAKRHELWSTFSYLLNLTCEEPEVYVFFVDYDFTPILPDLIKVMKRNSKKLTQREKEAGNLYLRHSLDARFIELLEEPENEADPIFFAAQLVSWRDPLISVESVLSDFQDIVQQARQAEIKTVPELCNWFRSKFKAARNQDYQNPETSFLDYAIQTGKGIPITNSLLFYSIARELSIDGVYMMNTPRHFICCWDDGMNRTFIDVFNDCVMLSDAEIYSLHPYFRGCLGKDQYCTTYQLVQRMCNNLSARFRATKKEPMRILKSIGVLKIATAICKIRGDKCEALQFHYTIQLFNLWLTLERWDKIQDHLFIFSDDGYSPLNLIVKTFQEHQDHFCKMLKSRTVHESWMLKQEVIRKHRINASKSLHQQYRQG